MSATIFITNPLINKSALNRFEYKNANKIKRFDEEKMSGRYLKKKNYPKKTGIDFFAENNKVEFGWITTRKLSRAIARKLPHA